MWPVLLAGIVVAQPVISGDSAAPVPETRINVTVPPPVPASAPAPEKKASPKVFSPTYSNTPTPFGDFPGPAFGPSTPDRFFLMKELQGTGPGVFLDDNRTQLTGWVDASYNASSAHHDNLPMGFDNRANDLILQQNFFRVDRPVDTGRKDFDWGFRIDWIAPGIDARYTAARGLVLGPGDERKRIYGYDPLEFYTAFWFPDFGQGTTLLVGRFLCPGGYETIPSAYNLLFSHSYTYIYTPFTHTGALATTKLSDQWYALFGMVLGSDVFFDPTDQPTFVGGFKWVSLSKTDSVYFTTYINGGNYFGPRQRDNVQYFDLVYTHLFTSRFQVINEALFAYQTKVPDLQTVTWYGLDTIFQYDLTPRCYGAIRLENWVDSQGQRTGFKGLYTAITAGLTFKPQNWLYLRPEIRFDHNYGAAGPFEGKHNLFTIAQDVIVRW
jgi:hypothetical protein